MPYPDRYTQTEAQYGKSMADIILDLAETHTREQVIAILDVNPATFWRWSKRAGVSRECRWVRTTNERTEVSA